MDGDLKIAEFGTFLIIAEEPIEHNYTPRPGGARGFARGGISPSGAV